MEDPAIRLKQFKDKLILAGWKYSHDNTVAGEIWIKKSYKKLWLTVPKFHTNVDFEFIMKDVERAFFEVEKLLSDTKRDS